MRILIANRGEIARRIIGTVHHLGHTSVAVYADPDAGAPHVREATVAIRLGPAALTESYLSIERLLDAAATTRADAVHPGYGFLSENAGFARAVIDAGLVWVGPRPELVEQMGSKITARHLAVAAGVPVIPGHDGAQDDDSLAAAAEAIGYPVLVKAAAGGGGRGIRRVHRSDQFAPALAEARDEARRSFGDDAMIVERFVQRPRHVEVQVVGDTHGAVIHLGTRECSVQRRYQKLLEEAPAPNLPDEAREGLQRAAVELAAGIGYDSAGTVEFVVDADAIGHDPGAWWFLEMNTRLQVEHPVTEAITGLDLVELQIRAAVGEPLGITQSDVTFAGHAIEARINAEDPDHDFAPCIGTVHAVVVPELAWGRPRWDSAVESGSVISPRYDALIAKLVVRGDDREQARRRMAAALDGLLVGGITTNAGFHRWLIDQPAFVDATLTTRFVDETARPVPPERAGRAATLAASAWTSTTDRARASRPDPWHRLGSFRLTPHRRDRTVSLVSIDGEVTDVPVGDAPADDARAVHVDLGDRLIVVNVDGASHTYFVSTPSERWAPTTGTTGASAGAVVAPFPAVVAEVAVTVGDQVGGGDPVAVIEAMKMLHTLAAGGPGVVAEVRVAPGDQVTAGQVLVTFADPTTPHDLSAESSPE